MVAQMTTQIGQRNLIGKGLLWIGTAALLAQTGLFLMHFRDSLVRAGAQALGWIPALGLTLMRTLQDATWHPAGVLLLLARLLVSCWPLMLILIGIALVKRSGDRLGDNPRISRSQGRGL